MIFQFATTLMSCQPAESTIPELGTAVQRKGGHPAAIRVTALGEEAESEDLYALATEDEIEEGSTWWEEASHDDSWDELLDEMELEDLENSYEEEDMATMEAMFE